MLQMGKLYPERENLPPKIHHQNTHSPFLSNGYVQLSRRGRNKRHGPASCLKKKSKRRVIFHQANDQFTRAFDNAPRYVNERKPNRLHTPGRPVHPQTQPLHGAIEIHSQNHEPPPEGIEEEVF